MIEYKIDGNHWCPHMSYSIQSLIHHVHPSFLGQDLEHGHKCLCRKKKWRVTHSTDSQCKLHLNAIKVSPWGAGEISLWLRERAILAEDPDSITCTHMAAHTVCNSSTGGVHCPLLAPGGTAHMCTDKNKDSTPPPKEAKVKLKKREIK